MSVFAQASGGFKKKKRKKKPKNVILHYHSSAARVQVCRISSKTESKNSRFFLLFFFFNLRLEFQVDLSSAKRTKLSSNIFSKRSSRVGNVSKTRTARTNAEKTRTFIKNRKQNLKRRYFRRFQATVRAAKCSQMKQKSTKKRGESVEGKVVTNKAKRVCV